VKAGAASAGAAAVFLLLRTEVVRMTPAPNDLALLPFGERTLYVLKALGAYVLHLTVATPTVRLPHRPAGLADPLVLLGLAALLVSAAILLREKMRTPVSFGIALAGLSIAPALIVWLIQIPRWKDDVPVAERWFYLPLAGVAIAVGAALSRRLTLAVRVVGSTLLLVLAVASWNRSGMYRSQVALGSYAEVELLRVDAATLNPRELYFRYKLSASRHLRDGETAAALDDLLRADAVAPALAEHLPIIAQAELELGHPERAVEAMERLLSTGFIAQPEFVKQRRDFGVETLARMDTARLLHLLAISYAAAGRPEDATAAFRRSVDHAAPGAGRAAHLVDLGVHLRNTGNRAEARAAFERAAAEMPGWDRPARELAKLDRGEPRPGFR
jgi:hypothetical protein